MTPFRVTTRYARFTCAEKLKKWSSARHRNVMLLLSLNSESTLYLLYTHNKRNNYNTENNKWLSYHRGTAQRALSVGIL